MVVLKKKKIYIEADHTLIEVVSSLNFSVANFQSQTL